MRKAFYIFCITLFVFQNARSQYQNVLIDDVFNPEETTIAIDLTNPDVMVAGSNLQNLYYSTNGGATWTASVINSSHGVYGDPCVISDSAGNMYYVHLGSPLDKIVCQKSNNGGSVFNNGGYATMNNTKLQDKEWACVDLQNGNVYLTWTEYDMGWNPGPQDSSRILFSRSTDGGASFSNPVQLNQISGDCLYLDITDAHPCTGPNGEIYVTYMDSTGIRFNKSTDLGLTWFASQPVIDSGGSFRYYNIPGIYRIRAMPYNACDKSGGPNHGNIYVTWSDTRNGINNTDVFFARSVDGGNTWSAAQKINSDNSNNHNYRPAMAVDQTTGSIYIVYHDRRSASANDSVEMYMARSTDGGITWLDFKISATSYFPTGQFDGDYIDIAAHAGRVRPIWTRMDAFGTSVWTCIFDESATGIIENEITRFSVNPNPAKNIISISLLSDLKEQTGVIKNTSGKIVMQFNLTKASQNVFDVSQLSNGLYFVEIGNHMEKLIVMH